MLIDFINNLKAFGLEFLGLMYGIYAGKVKGNKDERFMGRISVFLDSISVNPKAGRHSSITRQTARELKDTAESLKRAGLTIGEDMAFTTTPISPFAGNNFGFYFPPEVGKDQNVFVVFPNGMPGTPFYIGSWWYPDQVPKEFRNEDKTVTKRGIKTKGGHFILFEDDNQSGRKKRTEIKSSSGHNVILNDTDKKVDVLSAGGLHVEMDDNANKIKIKAGKTSITLDGNSGKIFLHVEGAAQGFVRGFDLLSYLLGHKHSGVKPGAGITGGPVPPPTPGMVSTNIFGE